jgi:SGNH domain (fused to AT3 domains)
MPDCFGAAALDAAHPCSNPALRTVVTPTPDDAVLLPGWPCAQMRSSGIVFPCSFGVTAARARDTVALVGDSHAEHWRAALEVVAQAKRWRGINITRSGCPFNRAQVIVDNRADMPRCTRWNREARQWFRDHPEVHTVFVSAHRGASFEGDAVAGYRAGWHALPRSVRRIYVLRDTPRVAVLQTDCVTQMLRAKRPFTPCAEPRAVELPHDPEAEAARGPVDHRVRVLDLTDHICGPAVCSAVVGGVLVLKDEGHLTRTFSTTLGPYLLRELG